MDRAGATFLITSALAIVGIKFLLDQLDLSEPISNTTPTKTTLNKPPSNQKNSIKLLFGTQTGLSRQYALIFAETAKQQGFFCEVVDLKDYEPETLSTETAYILIILPTYEDGLPPPSATFFVDWLVDISTDFRVHRNLLNSVKFAVFGVGNNAYEANFNRVARRVNGCFKSLAATELLPLRLGNVAEDIDAQFEKWTEELLSVIARLGRLPNHLEKKETPSAQKRKKQDRLAKKRTILPPVTNNKGTRKTRKGTTETTIEKNDNGLMISHDVEEDSDEEGEPMIDVEDLGTLLGNKNKKKPSIPLAKTLKNDSAKESDEDDDEDEEEDENEEVQGADPLTFTREMLNPSLSRSLTKQGYRLIGSHSGVKLCRWTKAMLRGRGGCYKHTFYGITSFQCMEMTPSLACANKCVFCWRHHKNPVGKEWKWKVDAPEFLVESAVGAHQAMVKELKGVPGVKSERLEAATTIRHCALSLVGEPIIYPYINRFLDLLHEREISSFLVTNAQFPDKIDSLIPVTQLYVSVDAATKESLKKIDRPLFEDFWERFLGSFDSLARKGQRTVFRLTLVKEWNMEELSNYGELVGRGRPDFVEIKGVTFCGDSKASSLRITNVPFHEEVRRFAQELCKTPQMCDEYEIACEHEHSCCLLLAKKKFKRNGVWYTWIDYPQFHKLSALARAAKKEGLSFSFSSEDYAAETPSWCTFDSPTKGFDPDDVRFHRKANKPVTSGC